MATFTVLGGQVAYGDKIYRRGDEFEATEPLTAGLTLAVNCGQIKLISGKPEKAPAPKEKVDITVPEEPTADAEGVNSSTEDAIEKNPKKALIRPRGRGKK